MNGMNCNWAQQNVYDSIITIISYIARGPATVHLLIDEY